MSLQKPKEFEHMSALLLSLLSALFFSIAALLSRKGLTKVDPLQGTFITIVVAVPILVGFCFTNGDFANLNLLDQTIITYLALAGILNLVIGRTFAYCSTKIIGVSRQEIVTSTNVFYATIFSSIILNEAIGMNLVVAAILIFIGTWLALQTTSSLTIQSERKKYFIMGVSFGLAAGAAWGLSPVFFKVGAIGAKSAVLSNLASYLFAAMVYPALLIGSGHHKNLRNIDRPCFGYILVTGASVCIAQIFNYAALMLANVSLVTTVIGIIPLFTLLLSYLFIQELEKINLKTVIGVLLSVLGVYIATLT